MGEGIFGLGLIMRAVVQGEPMGHPSPGRPFLRCTGAEGPSWEGLSVPGLRTARPPPSASRQF